MTDEDFMLFPDPQALAKEMRRHQKINKLVVAGLSVLTLEESTVEAKPVELFANIEQHPKKDSVPYYQKFNRRRR